MAEFVRMKHPDIDGEATVSAQAIPGLAARGWLLIERAVDASAPTAVPVLTRPASNGSADQWRTYAVAVGVLGAPGGLTYDEAMAANRDQLVAHFADQPEPPDPSATPADPADPQES